MMNLTGRQEVVSFINALLKFGCREKLLTFNTKENEVPTLELRAALRRQKTLGELLLTLTQ